MSITATLVLSPLYFGAGYALAKWYASNLGLKELSEMTDEQAAEIEALARKRALETTLSYEEALDIILGWVDFATRSHQPSDTLKPKGTRKDRTCQTPTAF